VNIDTGNRDMPWKRRIVCDEEALRRHTLAWSGRWRGTVNAPPARLTEGSSVDESRYPESNGCADMTPASNWTTRLVAGSYPDRTFDRDFWQKQGDEAIFSAAWEMIELAEEMKHGREPELQRTVTTLKRLPG